MSTTRRKLPLPLTLLLCAVFAAAAWTAINLTTADSASASVESLYVGNVYFVDEGYVNEEATLSGGDYDSNTNTLTLTNMTVPCGADPNDPDNEYGGITYSGSDDLTIKIKGTVTFPEGTNISYGGDESTTGGTIRIIGDGQSESEIIQNYPADKVKTPLFDFCTIDPEDYIPCSLSRLIISGVTINSTGGIDSDFTNMAILNSTWTMDCGDAPIRMGRRLGAGVLSVTDSTILMRNFKKTTEFPYAISCKTLTLSGVSLYGGTNMGRNGIRFQTKITPTSNGFTHNGYTAYQISKTAPQLWYKMTFNANGGSKLSQSSRWVKAGSAYGTMPTAKKTHYKLAGWYTAKSGGTKVTAATKPSKSTTLYAHWKVTGKKKKVRLVTSMKSSFGGSFRITYYKNGMVKKIKNSMDIWTFTYDDDMRYATVAHYQPHFKKAKKPLYKITFNYSTKKAKYASNYFGDSWSAPFKVNKAGQLTYFNNSGIGERYTFSYNKKGYLVKEVMKRGSRIRLNVTYKRNSKGLIRSVSHNDKDLEGLIKGKYSYSMKNGVPKRSTAKVQSYTDKVTFKYKTKTVRDWQKKIIMDQQRMLYSMDHNWGAALLSI